MTEATGMDGEDNDDKNGESLPHDHRLIVESHHAHPPRPPARTPSLPTRSPAFTHARTRVVHAHPPHTPTRPYTRPCSPPHTQPQPLDYTPALALLPPSFHIPIVPNCRSPPPPPAPSIYLQFQRMNTVTSPTIITSDGHQHPQRCGGRDGSPPAHSPR